MRVRFSRNITKQYDKADEAIQKKFHERLDLFLHDSHHPLLYNHALTGQLSGFRSINITGDWRALYTTIATDGEVNILFTSLGTHSELYR